MTTRRTFIASVLAAAATPSLTWADAGSPAYLAAAKEPDGGFALFGLDVGGADLFRVPLPDRGHAAAAHPVAPEAVAFARRPGTFALVIDCARGKMAARLDAPAGRHFYGHGVFLQGGDVLATPENDFENGVGKIGFWSRPDGYQRIGEIASGGIGPHDAARLPGDVMVVANGGILTRPDRDNGREKLNIDTMKPNLTYLDDEGQILEQVELDPDLSRNSIRHLALGPDGQVAFAMQWQGHPMDGVPLLGLHRRGETAVLAEAGLAEQIAMEGYAGSVAFDGAGECVGITSPRGGRVHLFDTGGGFLRALMRDDVCGLARGPKGMVATDGLGGVMDLDGERLNVRQTMKRAWDNHLVAL